MRRALAALVIAATATLLGAAPVRNTDGYFFVVGSDPQFGMYRGDSSWAQETANFEFFIATMNRLHPAFVVLTGDLINNPGSAAQAAEFWRIARQLDRSIPLYPVAGNHDVQNTPTRGSIAAYRRRFGADHYTFRAPGLVGIVLNSQLIDSSRGAPDLFTAQERWLDTALATARRDGARHVLVFQHHPWFLKDPSEPDQYFNIPLEQRRRYLALFHAQGVEALFSGHYHQNAEARDGRLAAITTGPIGKPFGGERSGFRIVWVSDSGLRSRYVDFGDVPPVVAR